jgi:hypothetical protein
LEYQTWFIRTQDVVFSKKETITYLPFVPIVSNATVNSALNMAAKRRKTPNMVRFSFTPAAVPYDTKTAKVVERPKL